MVELDPIRHHYELSLLKHIYSFNDSNSTGTHTTVRISRAGSIYFSIARFLVVVTARLIGIGIDIVCA